MHYTDSGQSGLNWQNDWAAAPTALSALSSRAKIDLQFAAITPFNTFTELFLNTEDWNSSLVSENTRESNLISLSRSS